MNRRKLSGKIKKGIIETTPKKLSGKELRKIFNEGVRKLLASDEFRKSVEDQLVVSVYCLTSKSKKTGI